MLRVGPSIKWALDILNTFIVSDLFQIHSFVIRSVNVQVRDSGHLNRTHSFSDNKVNGVEHLVGLGLSPEGPRTRFDQTF